MENFDEYQKRVLDILKESNNLINLNKELSGEVTALTQTNALLEKTLLDRESDLAKLSNVVIQNVVESVELLKTLQRDVLNKRKTSQIQYELDICMSCKRSLERDCMLQKNENQRLTCLNSQVTQELKTLRHNHCEK